MTREVKLTQNQVALVDDEDFERINQFKWCAHWNPTTKSFYAVRTKTVINPITGRQFYLTIRMTNTILNTTKLIDHRNHRTLNNQKCNLRICTVNENNQNRRKQKNCTSKYKGVYLDKRNNKWYALIGLRDIFDQPFAKYLGRFTDEIKAAKAYDRAAIENYEEFACLNFKEG